MPKHKTVIQFASVCAEPDILFIAGEHSGDQHTAKMWAQARALQPDMRAVALGGPALEQAGAELLFDLTEHSVVGLVEVLKRYSFFKQLFEKTLDWIRKNRPKTICFVDYPGFNLRLAQALHKEGLTKKSGGPIQLLFYISPQVWAWKGKRRFKMAKYLDALGVIFPFEVDCYADTELEAEFVGHPFVADDFDLRLAYDKQGPILLLPGSRLTSVGHIFPKMLAGYCRYVKTQTKPRKACVVCPSEVIGSHVEALIAKFPDLKGLIQVSSANQAIGVSMMLTSSGTMSFKCALAGIPGAIVYVANPLTFFIGSRLVHIPLVGIANILLKREAWPEYLQAKSKPKYLANEIQVCLNNVERATAAQESAKALYQLLIEHDGQSAGAWLVKKCSNGL